MLNFSITELCKSDTAIKNGIKNIPSVEVCDNLLNLIFYILQPVRNKFGAIQITSGFRCEQLNKLVGGVPTSNHRNGFAADVIPLQASFKQVYDYIVNNLDYDECFIETNKQGVKWLHVAYRKGNNRKKHNSNYIA